MNPKAITGAFAGAVVGAIVWAVVAATANVEIGYIAWGIGLAVGLGAKFGGSEGQKAGVICAVLALASIFAGKMFTVDYAIREELGDIFAGNLTQEYYDEVMVDAADFAEIESTKDYAEFLVTHGYTDAAIPEDVTVEELNWFEKHTVERLRELQQDQPSFDEWLVLASDHNEKNLEIAMAEISVVPFVVEVTGQPSAMQGTGAEC